AIWSDSPQAKMYYTDTAGSLRWGSYGYGAWPDPIATSGGANVNYCIYAAGAPSGPPPTLSSIAVTPVNPTNLTSTTRQFTATATYSDGGTQDITTQAGWTSSVPAVATINSAGLATAMGAGSTTIRATLSAVTGSTTLTVQSAPLAITTTSLPQGTVGSGYSATLAGSGGRLPYNWSLANGTLP